MSTSKATRLHDAGAQPTTLTCLPTGTGTSTAGMRPTSGGALIYADILWRLANGELDGVQPKVIVLLAGTNNVGNAASAGDDDAKVADVTRGLKAIVDVMRAKAPKATIILMAIFPRNDNIAVMPTINESTASWPCSPTAVRFAI